MNDSAQSGISIPGFKPLAGMAEGYKMQGSSAAPDYHLTLARRYLQEELGIDAEKHFDFAGYDCHYGNNYGHAELRGEPKDLFMRPTFSTKLVLKRAHTDTVKEVGGAADGKTSKVFDSKTLRYGYHGTPPQCVKPILETALKPSGSGAALGAGVYFSPLPLYAQLYSSSGFHNKSTPTWTVDGKTLFVDVMFMIRFPDLAKYDCAIGEIQATIGHQYCLHKLFQGANVDPPLEGRVIGCIPPDSVSLVHLQAVVVKFHEKDPYGKGGEWDMLQGLCSSLEGDSSGDC